MSGIGDGDNSDLQRIREVNQAELRRRADQAQRNHQSRVERSFKEVMAEHGRERVAQQAQRQTAATTRTTPGDAASQRLLAQVRTQGQRAHADLAKKAELSRSVAGSALRGRAKGHRAGAVEAEARAEQLDGRGAEELEHAREHGRDQDTKDLRSVEEKQTEVAAEAQSDGPINPDGERRQRQQHSSSSGDDGAGPEKASAVDESPKAHRVDIPPALIQQLVNAVLKTVGTDGRTQMQIHLRGGPLDGVKLEVRSEGGQVECTFHGCDREMTALVEAGRELLAKGLAGRGLKLKNLTVA